MAESQEKYMLSFLERLSLTDSPPLRQILAYVDASDCSEEGDQLFELARTCPVIMRAILLDMCEPVDESNPLLFARTAALVRQEYRRQEANQNHSDVAKGNGEICTCIF